MCTANRPGERNSAPPPLTWLWGGQKGSRCSETGAWCVEVSQVGRGRKGSPGRGLSLSSGRGA